VCYLLLPPTRAHTLQPGFVIGVAEINKTKQQKIAEASHGGKPFESVRRPCDTFLLCTTRTHSQRSGGVSGVAAINKQIPKQSHRTALVPHNLSLFTTSLRMRVMISRVWMKPNHTSIQAYRASEQANKRVWMKFRTSALYASAKFRGGLSKNCRSLLRNLMFVPPPHLHTTARLRTD